MIFLTSILAISPLDGELTEFAGPDIEADSFDEAIEYCQENGLGYCKVEGELIEEVNDIPDFEINLN